MRPFTRLFSPPVRSQLPQRRVRHTEHVLQSSLIVAHSDVNKKQNIRLPTNIGGVGLEPISRRAPADPRSTMMLLLVIVASDKEMLWKKHRASLGNFRMLLRTF